jgi:hypothetical protein
MLPAREHILEARLISNSIIALAMKLVPTIAPAIFALLGLANLLAIGAGFGL